MRIIFAGTPDIAAAVLQSLINAEFNIIACLTQPDRPKGRGQQLAISPVKEIATKNNITVLQPKSLKNSETKQQLQDLNADLMIVLAYGLILPQAVLDIPKRGCINIHASLLPRWRGAAPIQQAILAGDKETGITIMQMDAGLDTGDMLSSYPCKITKDETSASLYQKLTILAQDAIIDTIDNNKFTPTPQDNALATLAPKIEKQQAKIDWQQSAMKIDSAIRAYNPWPVAFTTFQDQVVRVWKSKLTDNKSKSYPGTIIAVDKEAIEIATGDGTIRLLELQFPGKKVLPIAAICNSNKELQAGACFN